MTGEAALLAEIADKMPGPVEIVAEGWVLGAVPAVFGFLLSRIRWWLFFAGIPILAVLNAACYDELIRDVFFRDCIVNELGIGYTPSLLIALNVPMVAAAVLRIRIRGTPAGGR